MATLIFLAPALFTSLHTAEKTPWSARVSAWMMTGRSSRLRSWRRRAPTPAMPTIKTTSSALGTEDFVDFSDLDQLPRPIGASLDFPRRLRRKPASGRIVLLIKLDTDGSVSDVEVDSSNLPAFDDFVVKEVSRWKFTPPTQQGRPVRAKARLPFPIHIK